ncbi:GDSL esterase/lipase At5g45670 [Linum perenne]
MSLWVVTMVAISCLNWAAIAQQVPGYFIFGDSLVDNGNNNRLQSLARADYMPYGIDFPGGPTGRFSNGKTTVDVIGTYHLCSSTSTSASAEELGFDHPIPPFTTAQGQDILLGVNYASGSAGILDDTGSHLGRNVPLGTQVQNHQTTFSRIVQLKGNNNNSALEHLTTCLYYMQIGSNDYLNNYFAPDHYKSSKDFTIEAYATHLLSLYEAYIRTLYEFGARKIAVAGIGKIGCIPYSMNLFGTHGSKCIDKVNEGPKCFNKEAKRLVVKLNKEFSDAQLTYINSYGMGDGDPSLLGFKNVISGCCKSREDGQCEADQTPCDNRSEYVFWDSFHPTEASNKVTAARTYKSFTPSDSDPFDIHTLAKITLGKKGRKTEEL